MAALVMKAKPLFLFMHMLFQKVAKYPPKEAVPGFDPIDYGYDSGTFPRPNQGLEESIAIQYGSVVLGDTVVLGSGAGEHRCETNGCFRGKNGA